MRLLNSRIVMLTLRRSTWIRWLPPLDSAGELFRFERQTADAVVGDRVDEELRAQQHRELTKVHLRYDDLAVARQDVAGVGGQWVQMPQMRLRNVLPSGSDATAGGAD